MIHPSYVELMKVVNNNVEFGEEPVIKNIIITITLLTINFLVQIRNILSNCLFLTDKLWGTSIYPKNNDINFFLVSYSKFFLNDF